MNDQGVMGVLAGVGTARAAASIMALGLDPRFDFSKAYWLVAGIAGADPEDASLGSAVWAEWVVDGDLAYEIDAREIPPQWTTGYVPLNKTVPYEQPRNDENFAMFHLNPGLREWAYQQTKAVAARRFARRWQEREDALRRSECAPSTVRSQGRYAFRLYLLARQTARPMGEQLGQLSHRREGQFCYFRHGRHRRLAIAHLSFIRPGASIWTASWCCAR